jgi:hypothetical protein
VLLSDAERSFGALSFMFSLAGEAKALTAFITFDLGFFAAFGYNTITVLRNADFLV